MSSLPGAGCNLANICCRCVHTHQASGACLAVPACSSARGEQAWPWAPSPSPSVWSEGTRSSGRDGATPAGRFPRHRNLSLHTSPLPCDSDGSLHGQTDQIDLFLHGAPKSYHRTRDCPTVSLVRLLSGDPTGVGCNVWSLPGTCVCAVYQL